MKRLARFNCEVTGSLVLASDRKPPTNREDAIEMLRKRPPVNVMVLAQCRDLILGLNWLARRLP